MRTRVAALVTAACLATSAGAATLSPVAKGSAALPVQVLEPEPSTRLVVDQDGKIFVIRNGHERSVPFLDLSARTSASSESGLLGLALHPDFLVPGAAGEGLAWIFVTEVQSVTMDRILRFHVPRGTWAVDPSSEVEVLSWRAGGCHHGGHLLFGPRAESPSGPLLYVSVGDGCGGNPGSSPRDTTTPQGKILRIQPSLDTAAVPPWTAPPDNPGAGESGIASAWWARGLRNPWRCAFDAVTGDLWIADVGSVTDEVDVVPSGTAGMDFGWNVMEGTRCVTAGCTPVGVAPLFENIGPGTCAIIGGTVPRGGEATWLDGQFVFSDNCSGDVYAADAKLDGTWRRRILATVPDMVADVSPGAGGLPLVSTRDYWTSTGRVWSLGAAPEPLRGPGLVPVFSSSSSARTPVLLARGGRSAPAWQLLSGTLPPGVSFDAGGLRVDAPPVASFQPRTIRVRATNADGEMADASTCLVHSGSSFNYRFATPATPPPMRLVVRRDVAWFTRVRLVVTWRQPVTGPLRVVLRGGSWFQPVVDVTLDPVPATDTLPFLYDDSAEVSGTWELSVTRPDGSDASASVASWAIDGAARVHGCSDEDGDGVPSVTDACNAFADPGQEDADSDGIGDACDMTWGDVAPAGAPDGQVNVGDAVFALRASVGLVIPDAEQLRRMDVAPYDQVGTLARPWAEESATVDVADVVTILRVSVGLLELEPPR